MRKIPAAALDRLGREPHIAQQLASANLQRAFKDIAAAEAPAERLEEHLRCNPHLDAFMVECLTLLGLLPQRE